MPTSPKPGMARPPLRSELTSRREAASPAPEAVRNGSIGRWGADLSGPDLDGVSFVEAMEAIRTAQEVDAVTQVGVGGAGEPGPGLARAMFRFVMPRLDHPEVLRADTYRRLLEAFEAQLLNADRGDDLAQRGIRVIQQDLWRLAALRLRRNGLIDG